MIVKIVICLTIGILIGYFIEPQFLFIFNSSFEFLKLEIGILEVILALMMLLVGIDIAYQKNFYQEVKKMGRSFWVYPILNVIFSMLGGLVGALLINYDLIKGIAISSALGWYTLATVEFATISLQFGAIAFLTNSLRELFAMILMPFLIKRFGKMSGLASAGATCMDTNLPISVKSAKSNQFAVVAIINGTFLSLIAAILIIIFKGII